MTSVPAGFEQTVPDTMTLVQQEEGLVVTARLTNLGYQEVQIGMPVEMITRKIRTDRDERGIIVYG